MLLRRGAKHLQGPIAARIVDEQQPGRTPALPAARRCHQPPDELGKLAIVVVNRHDAANRRRGSRLHLETTALEAASLRIGTGGDASIAALTMEDAAEGLSAAPAPFLPFGAPALGEREAAATADTGATGGSISPANSPSPRTRRGGCSRYRCHPPSERLR